MLLFVCIGGECVLVVLIVNYVYTVGSLHCGCIGSDCVGVVYGVWGGLLMCPHILGRMCLHDLGSTFILIWC